MALDSRSRRTSTLFSQPGRCHFIFDDRSMPAGGCCRVGTHDDGRQWVRERSRAANNRQ